ncbi:MAG: dihydrolipoyl dehydrogenase [Planctomycetota bacterium]|nr:MAG: dihydrolipoyl dehydrogenase [Planctomycetota bacterium]
MDFDVTVIGGGPGGYVAAIRASQLGKKVALIEEKDLGGICLNWGCIPTKTLLKSAELYQQIQKKGKTFGLQVGSLEVDYNQIIQNSRNVANRLSKGIGFLMKKNKIQVFSGRGRLLDSHTIEIEGSETKTITSSFIILATGARPRELPNLKADGKRIWNSRHSLSSREKPSSVVVVGAGAIGVEFAYFWNALGVPVTLVEMESRILPIEDEEISGLLTKSFQKQGIQIRTSTVVQKVKEKDEGLLFELESKGKKDILEASHCLLAIGVQGNSQNLGLENLGIKVEKSWIQVNDFCQTSIPHIYAIGDVNGPPWLAHVASKEGILAVEHLAGLDVQPLDLNKIPGCTYCHPQVASVGMTEAKALEAGYEIKVGRFPMRASGKALAMGESEGVAKVVIDAKYGELLGCHIIGPEATEFLTEFTVAMTGELTYQEILDTIHPHPTMSETLMEAVHEAIGEGIHI